MIEPLVLASILLMSRALDVPAPLIMAIIDQESGFNFHAAGDPDEFGLPRSYGLMMINLDGAGYGYTPDMLLNPVFNIMVGTECLKACMNAFPNNLKLAISAYNQGMGGAAKRGYGFNETYVNNILALKQKYEEELKPKK